MATLRYHSETGGHIDPVKSTTSIVAIIAAVASFFLVARDNEGWGLIAALVAVGAGFIGGLKALSPRVSGGLLSIMAVALGAIAVVVALIALIMPG